MTDLSPLAEAEIIRRARRSEKRFALLGLSVLSLTMLVLLTLIIDFMVDGLGRIDYDFLTSFPSRRPNDAGILSAWVGSVLVMIVTASLAVPLGVAASLYLEEYAPKNLITNLIEINVTNLAGVPSIIYGLLALGLFIQMFGLGQTIFVAGLTLALLILPIIIVATREAVRSIPQEVREAAFALGADKWQTVGGYILPAARPGILTGAIVGMSRAIGETAPIITIGALTFIAFLPPSPVGTEFPFINFDWLGSPFTVMPIQMFNWVSRPQAGFHINAAATGLILLAMTLLMNAGAIWLRYKLRRAMR
ncbi:phosphate ABC transporter permease PstA [Ancylobacter sp. TS-1]|uniref:phosphate ABC transporter permease PstA n=1 Tax=Ancylobacter sp. TS-1 TaxID=1850374 RepID=UPI001265D72E|nr:phosphate ABC transporter permease PstA [Ancylobacter sp. TS-1]QFR34670.1 phosphate ABC transporter permease PstA [Ancylobacter sp. TS-1]